MKRMLQYGAQTLILGIALGANRIRKDKLVADMKNPILDSLGAEISIARLVQRRIIMGAKNALNQRNKQYNYRQILFKIFLN